MERNDMIKLNKPIGRFFWKPTEVQLIDMSQMVEDGQNNVSLGDWLSFFFHMEICRKDVGFMFSHRGLYPEKEAWISGEALF